MQTLLLIQDFQSTSMANVPQCEISSYTIHLSRSFVEFNRKSCLYMTLSHYVGTDKKQNKTKKKLEEILQRMHLEFQAVSMGP